MHPGDARFPGTTSTCYSDEVLDHAAPRKWDEAPHERDEAPHERDEAPHERDEAPRRRDEAPRRRDEAPHERDEAPRRRDEAPRKWDEALESGERCEKGELFFRDFRIFRDIRGPNPLSQ
jgi:hypothetical protein